MRLMKRMALIELYAPGIVLFDPVILASFIKSKAIINSNIFEAFLSDEVVGRQAVEQGVVCPIYQISEAEYSVFALPQNEVDLPEPEFTYSGFPLAVVSGLLIVADLNSLLDWDADFFLNYMARYGERLSNNDFIDVDPGLYDLTIKGYLGLSEPFAKSGYGIEFAPVTTLPDVADSAAVSDVNFELVAR